MDGLFHFPNATRQAPEVEAWFDGHTDEPGRIAKLWFGVLRSCGDDVRELLHDGHPTACVIDAAFAYVDAFKSHVNVGFYRGAELADPDNLLEGKGRNMRHVKLRPGAEFDEEALTDLIHNAYMDMRGRLTQHP